MVTLTCFVADCNLSDAGTPPPTVTQLTLGGKPIGEYFRLASGSAQLDIAFNWSRRDALRPFQRTDGVSDDELLHLLPQVLGADEDSNPPSIGLLLASRYDAAPGQYGLMFDIDRQDGSSGQRQGCALFLGPIWDKFFTEPAEQAAPGFQEAVAYIAVHEIGHAFNLWHEGDNSFMEAHPAPDQLGQSDFNSQQQGYLALAAESGTADYVLPGPGREPFGTLAPGFSGSDDSPFASPADSTSGLSLRIGLSHEAFWTFEPIELDVELSLSKSSGPATIADEIDPGYASFQIWITRPDGQRFRYRGQTRFCCLNGDRRVVPGQSIRRDIAIGRQSGGSTFSIPGRYEVQVAFRLPTGSVLLSNVATCAVRSADPSSLAWAQTKSMMQHPTTQRMLRYKRWAPSYRESARLAQFADEEASPPTSDAINYALGKSLLVMSRTVLHEAYAEDMRRRAANHLRNALDGGRLSPHRAQAVASLLKSIRKSGKRHVKPAQT
jgi:hypothetical protein